MNKFSGAEKVLVLLILVFAALAAVLGVIWAGAAVWDVATSSEPYQADPVPTLPADFVMPEGFSTDAPAVDPSADPSAEPTTEAEATEEPAEG